MADRKGGGMSGTTVLKKELSADFSSLAGCSKSRKVLDVPLYVFEGD
jgi:hypothetical protein